MLQIKVKTRKSRTPPLGLLAFGLVALSGVANQSLAAVSPVQISNELRGEWREACMKSLDTSGRETTAPFVLYKMVIGSDDKIEQNYTYFTDAKCTKKKSSRREWATYKTLNSNAKSAKILLRKDLGDGMIHESLISLNLSGSQKLEMRVLNTRIDLDELLNEPVEPAVVAPESSRFFTRHEPDSRPARSTPAKKI